MDIVGFQLPGFFLQTGDGEVLLLALCLFYVGLEVLFGHAAYGLSAGGGGLLRSVLLFELLIDLQDRLLVVFERCKLASLCLV